MINAKRSIICVVPRPLKGGHLNQARCWETWSTLEWTANKPTPRGRASLIKPEAGRLDPHKAGSDEHNTTRAVLPQPIQVLGDSKHTQADEKSEHSIICVVHRPRHEGGRSQPSQGLGDSIHLKWRATEHDTTQAVLSQPSHKLGDSIHLKWRATGDNATRAVLPQPSQGLGESNLTQTDEKCRAFHHLCGPQATP